MAKTKSKKRLPTRYEHIELDGEWEGWSFKARVSLGMDEFAGIMEKTTVLRKDTDASPAEIGAALRAVLEHLRSVVQSWDFVDGDGEPLPLEEDESWKLLPVSLVVAMQAGANERISSAPLVKGDS